ncbi:non ribosomal peptide synthetase BasB [Pseudomonas entomophila]|uniref:condensation domain-containing protein n=1 Tax=Pseudomonas entomophila TaxID=312306 RepID=UPI0015E3529F|nr:condensation domain-containing protein [Pseudomonas entomophila]MBA1190430.1 non ribosomal peptide synthetase BasB [Pseudomonas entomophila]
MMERSPDTPPALSATPHEAHVWLLQTQYPELTLKHVTAWRLTDTLEPSRLEAALAAVIDSLPVLNARYRFDDQGDLLKLAGAHWRDCVHVWQVSGDAQARERLSALQAQPWDPASEPPLAARIVDTGDSLLLAFVLHSILDPVCRADDLYRMTLNAYAGQPVGRPDLPWLDSRQAPAQTDVQTPAGAPQASSQTHVEALILDEFRQALGEPGMTANDDFFDFGGHSLLATRIVGRLAGTHGVQVRFNDFFSASSAAALAARAQLAEAEHDEASLALSDDVSQAPFAPAQASLGRAYQAFDFGTIFNLPFAMDFVDPVDEAVLEQAFTDLLHRHASLRTTYHFDAPTPCQRQVPVERLGPYSWFWSSARSQGVTLASEATHCFDLSRELPLRVRVLRDPQTGRQQLSLLVHHMAIDEWSLNVMMQELAQAYAARAADRAPVWAAPAPAFQVYAQQASARGIDARHLAYWTDLLRDVTPGLHLPAVTSPTGAAQAPAEAGSTEARWFEIQPDQATIDGLYTFARQNDASLFGVLYTGIALALHKVGNLRELVIGTSASGRTDPVYYDTVGYFTTMVAHPVRFEPRQPVGELIEGVSRLINDSMAYADVPLEQIQQALGRTPDQGLLFDVYIQIHANNALNGALSTPAGEAIRYRQIDPDKSQSMFGLQFEILENVLDGKRTLRLVVTYLTARYSEAQMARVRQAIEQVFAAFTRDETAALSVQHVMA